MKCPSRSADPVQVAGCKRPAQWAYCRKIPEMGGKSGVGEGGRENTVGRVRVG